MEGEATSDPRAQEACLRTQGMRLIQIWVPDLHSPESAAEAKRQSMLEAKGSEEAEIQSFIDSVYEWPDDEYSQ